MIEVDLQECGLSSLNSRLHAVAEGANETEWCVLNPQGAHAVLVSADGYEVLLEVKLNKNFPHHLAFIPENFKAVHLNRLMRKSPNPCSVEIKSETRSQV